MGSPDPTIRVGVREIRYPAVSAGPHDSLHDFMNGYRRWVERVSPVTWSPATEFGVLPVAASYETSYHEPSAPRLRTTAHKFRYEL